MMRLKPLADPFLKATIGLLLIFIMVPGRFANAADDDQKLISFPPALLNEEVVRIPVDDPPAVTLQVTIFHPNGSGPFPLAIMNHGATEISRGHRGERYRLTNGAFYFLSRGYAVALPMMRGFAASGGELYHNGCDLAGTGMAYAKDIRAVIRYLSSNPHIDAKRVIVAGQSFGGWNTLAVGALNIPGVKGLINFNGGIRTSECKTGDSSLVAGASQFGAATKTPSIWFYGDNDELFAVPVWHGMYDSYNRSGGHAEIVDIGVFLKNSHNFLPFPEALPLWIPEVDSFLARINLPNTSVNPVYLAQPFPASLTTPLIFYPLDLAPIRADSLPDGGILWMRLRHGHRSVGTAGWWTAEGHPRVH